MKLTLSPMRRNDQLTLSRMGDVLIINSDAFDFSGVPEGASLPSSAIASSWIAGRVTRKNGVLNVPLILPHGARAPTETLFPDPITLAGDGPVTLPPYSVETPA